RHEPAHPSAPPAKTSRRKNKSTKTKPAENIDGFVSSLGGLKARFFVVHGRYAGQALLRIGIAPI
ncbi:MULTISPECIES: hypothetical protein, partial [unclassified Neorhizobium]|uniref:hypothetical protein n=1 Tax=unclassified Neorhizobium TaxID=2629175 RepID=UPI001FF58DD2